MKEGLAGAVKLEGGMEMVETARLMAAVGIPVIAHIGLKPSELPHHGRLQDPGEKPRRRRQAGGGGPLQPEKAGAFAL